MDQILGQDIGSDSIEHHGVKGQKWGVKRYAKELGYNTVSRYTHPIASIGPNFKAHVRHPISYKFAGKKYLNASNTALRSKLARKKIARAKRIKSMKMSAIKSKDSARKVANAISKKSAKFERAKSMKMSAIKSKVSSKKASREAASASKAREKDWNKDYTNRSSMSTPELREKVTRLTLENQLRQQVSIANPAKKSAARQVITQVGTELLRNVAQQAGQQVLKQALTKMPH